MEVWQIWCVFGLLLLILEMFTPALFFLNLALAAFFTAILAYFGISYIVQTVFFALISSLLILFLRPFLVSKLRSNNSQTGIGAKYIGHEAKVIKEVTKTSGRIALYGEDWDARTLNDEVIPVDSVVNIIKNDSLILFVEKL